MICGIYSSVDEFKKHRNTIEYLTYSYDNGRQFVIYCWNIFSTIYFVQECLKRFGNSGDQFVLTYREKDEKETESAETEAAVQEELVQQFNGAQRLFSGSIGKIYPDFISQNPESRVIADAKYKPIDNIGNKDYLQVLAYMFRFEAKIGYFLYPEAEGTEDKQLWLNRGTTYEKNVVPREEICVIKHGLKIPADAGNYETFVSMMKQAAPEITSVSQASKYASKVGTNSVGSSERRVSTAARYFFSLSANSASLARSRSARSVITLLPTMRSLISSIVFI